MIKSPFKFLDSYTLDDRAVFFGRDQEITELCKWVFENIINQVLKERHVSAQGMTCVVSPIYCIAHKNNNICHSY